MKTPVLHWSFRAALPPTKREIHSPGLFSPHHPGRSGGSSCANYGDKMWNFGHAISLLGCLPGGKLIPEKIQVIYL